jgi:hypothetical protein
MTDLLALSWRAYPAALLCIIGAGLAVSGLDTLATLYTRRQRRGPFEWAFVYLFVFRRLVVGLALVGAAVGWAWQVPWLAAASVCIGSGELLESSYYISVLRWGQRRGLVPRPTRTGAGTGCAPVLR